MQWPVIQQEIGAAKTLCERGRDIQYPCPKLRTSAAEQLHSLSEPPFVLRLDQHHIVGTVHIFFPDYLPAFFNWVQHALPLAGAEVWLRRRHFDALQW